MRVDEFRPAARLSYVVEINETLQYLTNNDRKYSQTIGALPDTLNLDRTSRICFGLCTQPTSVFGHVFMLSDLRGDRRFGDVFGAKVRKLKTVSRWFAGRPRSHPADNPFSQV